MRWCWSSTQRRDPWNDADARHAVDPVAPLVAGTQAQPVGDDGRLCHLPLHAGQLLIACHQAMMNTDAVADVFVSTVVLSTAPIRRPAC